MPFVRLDEVSVTYKGHGGEVEALSSVSLAAEKGEAWAVIGPSGCGKSTLLYALAGLVPPTTGSIFIGGERLLGERRETSIILQDYGLFPWKTVYENAALGLKIRHYSREEVARKTRDILIDLRLLDFKNRFPSQLSGGMRQRVALARSLTLDPDLLLMDEPFSSLDALTREELQNNLLEVRQADGLTTFLVTHSIEEAVFLGRKILVLTSRPGKIAEIVDNPGMGALDYRNRPEFHEVCSHLRHLLRKGNGDG
ncbi:MAG: ABC transporter ATP-binding protein [Actinobacteria bacterium]|nr:ABC transporter ATP-binding protein [Actinomycetota bacterium]